MSLIRLVPAGIHALGDYAAGIVLLLAGLFADGPDAARATGIVLGAVLIVVSLLTRYPLGAVRIIPFPVHSGGDYVGGLAAILAPFVLGFSDDNAGVSALYVVVGAVVIALSLVTNYSWGPDHQRVVVLGEADHGTGYDHTPATGGADRSEVRGDRMRDTMRDADRAGRGRSGEGRI